MEIKYLLQSVKLTLTGDWIFLGPFNVWHMLSKCDSLAIRNLRWIKCNHLHFSPLAEVTLFPSMQKSKRGKIERRKRKFFPLTTTVVNHKSICKMKRASVTNWSFFCFFYSLFSYYFCVSGRNFAISTGSLTPVSNLNMWHTHTHTQEQGQETKSLRHVFSTVYFVSTKTKGCSLVLCNLFKSKRWSEGNLLNYCEWN